MSPPEADDAPKASDAASAKIGNHERYEIGRLAFESPALLGGAAGRMGLSCSSCHLNGRDNTDFFLEGLSDAPGRADVTSNLLSKVRGDSVFNPAPIPDLAKKDGKQIRDRLSPEFRTKVHGLVVEEFDGQEPPKFVFDALISFMNAQDVSKCADPSARTAVRAGGDVAEAREAMRLASLLEDNGERDAARLIARVARERLGAVHERFVSRDQADLREALISASRSIEVWITQTDSKTEKERIFAETDRQLVQAAALVERRQAGSLYNPDVLRAALAQQPG
ncbi:MAG: hypothetical protein ABL956_19120 [Hyphomonadaceae bacterium]